MPTSNGQIGRFDIRRGAVVTTALADESVTTAKIPDLAVTFPDKIDLPTQAYVFEHSAGPTSVTTTEADISTTIDVPAWADSVSVFAFAQMQVSNTTGATVNAQLRCEIDGSPASGVLSVSIDNNETGSVFDFQKAALVGVAGSTITVAVAYSVNSGTLNDPYIHVGGMAVFSR